MTPLNQALLEKAKWVRKLNTFNEVPHFSVGIENLSPVIRKTSIVVHPLQKPFEHFSFRAFRTWELDVSNPGVYLGKWDLISTDSPGVTLEYVWETRLIDTAITNRYLDDWM
ncbi:hypothetical protein J6590_081140 [Homalodisca vitripennis]|nr:hypothetical protein J6590_081140 [Homalodisca vitripennis]